MLSKLGYADLMSAFQSHVEKGTGRRCYDHADDEKSPFYCAELIDVEPENTKTMFVDVFTIGVHCIAAPSKSFAGVYELIERLEDAMTDELRLEPPYEVVGQLGTGLMTIKEDESGEKHAVVGYEVSVCYGLNVK